MADKIKWRPHPNSDEKQLALFLGRMARRFPLQQFVRCHGKKLVVYTGLASAQTIYTVMTALEDVRHDNNGRLGFSALLSGAYLPNEHPTVTVTIQPPAACWGWKCFQEDETGHWMDISKAIAGFDNTQKEDVLRTEILERIGGGD